jgi:hypothetical protein
MGVKAADSHHAIADARAHHDHLQVAGSTYALGIGIAAFCVLNLINLAAGQPFWLLTQLINLGLESSLPTWYSSMLWGVAAVLAWRCRDASEDSRAANTWLFLALVFAFFSIDEIAMIHERVGRFIATHSGAYGELYGTARWVPMLGPVALLALGAIAWYARPVYQMAPCSWRLLGIGLAIFLAAALGIESTTNLLNHDTMQWWWDLEIVIEETLEMLGTWLVIEACSAFPHDSAEHG